MKFVIHSAFNRINPNGDTYSEMRGHLPTLGCGGELVMRNNKGAMAFCSTYEGKGKDAVLVYEGIAQKRFFKAGKYPVVELADDFTTSTKNVDYTKDGVHVEVRIPVKGQELEIFRILPVTQNANWCAKVLPAEPMPKVAETSVEDVEAAFA